MVWGSALAQRVPAPEEVKQAAEPSVRVASARFELHLKHQVLGIGDRTVGSPPIGEQPHAVPCDRIDAPIGDHRRECVDVITAGVDTEAVDLSIAVERGEGGGPVAFVGVPHRHHLDVLGDDRQQASGRSQSAQRVENRRRVVEIHEHAVAKDASEDFTVEHFRGVLAPHFDESHPMRDRSVLVRECCSARSSIDADGSTIVTA